MYRVVFDQIYLSSDGIHMSLVDDWFCFKIFELCECQEKKQSQKHRVHVSPGSLFFTWIFSRIFKIRNRHKSKWRVMICRDGGKRVCACEFKLVMTYF